MGVGIVALDVGTKVQSKHGPPQGFLKSTNMLGVESSCSLRGQPVSSLGPRGCRICGTVVGMGSWAGFIKMGMSAFTVLL